MYWGHSTKLELILTVIKEGSPATKSGARLCINGCLPGPPRHLPSLHHDLYAIDLALVRAGFPGAVVLDLSFLTEGFAESKTSVNARRSADRSSRLSVSLEHFSWPVSTVCGGYFQYSRCRIRNGGL